MKNKVLNVLLIAAVFLLTCLAIASGSYFRSGLTGKVGSPSEFKILAPVDVENNVATEANRTEAETRAANTPPILTRNPDVLTQVTDNIDGLNAKISSIRLAYQNEVYDRRLAAEEAARLAAEEAQRIEAERLAEEQRLAALAAAAIESGGISAEDLAAAAETISGSAAPPPPPSPTAAPLALPSAPPLASPTTEPAAEPVAEPVAGPITAPAPVPEPLPAPSSEPEEEPFESLETFATLSVVFKDEQKDFLVNCTEVQLRELFSTSKDVAQAALEQGVQDLDSKTLLAVQDEFKGKPVDELTADIGYEIVTTYLTPNVFENEEQTNAEREKIADDYERVKLVKGQLIVDEGQIITAEIYDMLERLDILDTGLETKVISMVGVFALIAFVFLCSVLYLVFFRKTMAHHRKEVYLLVTLYIIELVAVWSLRSLDYYFLPLLIFPMLVSILIDSRLSLILSVGVTVTDYFVINGSMEYLLFFMLAGILISLLSKYTTERSKIFLVGFLIAFLYFLLSCAISFVTEKNEVLQMSSDIFAKAGFTALNGMFTVIICMGTLPFWETFFGVVTPVKLLDLTNPTNPLLRRLTIEAPGTYHHSLIVANLAETAAYDIGANPHTARAGGYYHDIGKLKYPQYFAENLAGENPHDHMDPFNSVQLIVSHVAYGLTLATEYRLPQFIRDIISEHHGTTLIQFFYSKAKEENPDTPVNEADFRYPYTIPQTRESACVMLADTVEAAVRSMIPHVKSVEEVEGKINFLIRHKLNDGQLADSQLSIKDVTVIGQSFFRVLKGMYHERIPYPKLVEKDGDA